MSQEEDASRPEVSARSAENVVAPSLISHVELRPRTPEELKAEARRKAVVDRGIASALELLTRDDIGAIEPTSALLWLIDAATATVHSCSATGLENSWNPADVVKKFRSLITPDDVGVPVCVIYLRRVDPAAKDSLTPAEIEAAAATRLKEAPAWTQSVVEASRALADLPPLFEVLLAAEGIHRHRVKLPAIRGEERLLKVETISSHWMELHAKEIIELTEYGEVDVEILLTMRHTEWQRQQMKDRTASELPADHAGGIQAAAKQLLDAAQQLSMPGLSSGLEIDLVRVQAVWEVVRTEVKGRLETFIERLSRAELSTFEEKKTLARTLAKLIDRWEFRAVSPVNQKPAILRCRQTRGLEEGYFQFESRVESEAGTNPSDGAKRQDREALGTYLQLPAFQLVDRPPDKRQKS